MIALCLNIQKLVVKLINRDNRIQNKFVYIMCVCVRVLCTVYVLNKYLHVFVLCSLNFSALHFVILELNSAFTLWKRAAWTFGLISLCVSQLKQGWNDMRMIIEYIFGG